MINPILMPKGQLYFFSCSEFLKSIKREFLHTKKEVGEIDEPEFSESLKSGKDFKSIPCKAFCKNNPMEGKYFNQRGKYDNIIVCKTSTRHCECHY